MNTKSLRPEQMTVKQYALYLGGVSTRTIENWEYRGTNHTTQILLAKIHEQAKKIDELQTQIKEKNLIFNLPIKIKKDPS